MFTILEQKVESCDAKGIDFLSYVSDEAQKEIPIKVVSDKPQMVQNDKDSAIAYFQSGKFAKLVNAIKSFKTMKKCMTIKLEDYVRNQAQEHVD